jgi:hypothetical protein
VTTVSKQKCQQLQAQKLFIKDKFSVTNVATGNIIDYTRWWTLPCERMVLATDLPEE